MNNRDEHIIHSLRRWIEGDIKQKEENRLDRQAREDAFLGEALDGYRQFPGSKHHERLERMREQLQANTQKGKKRSGLFISMPYRIAAAAAIVLAFGVFWWLNPPAGAELAEAEPATEMQRKDRSETPPPAVLEDQVAADEVPVENPGIAESSPESNRSAELPASTAAEPQQPPPGSASAQTAGQQEASGQTAEALTARPKDSLMAEDDASEALDQSRGLAAKESTTPAPAATMTDGYSLDEIALEAPQGTRLVTGQVLDPAGTPLKGVLVVTPGSQTGTITNNDGQYEILLDSNVQQLEFQRIGFSSQQVDIPDAQDFVRVTLDEMPEATEPVVARQENAAKKSKTDATVNPAVHPSSLNEDIARPTMSQRRFARRLSKDLQYPQEAVDQRISGSVTLRFTILPDGQVMNVKAISGPAPLQAEAIRLIEQGPRWRILNGKNKSVTLTYRLDFSL